MEFTPWKVNFGPPFGQMNFHSHRKARRSFTYMIRLHFFAFLTSCIDLHMTALLLKSEKACLVKEYHHVRLRHVLRDRWLRTCDAGSCSPTICDVTVDVPSTTSREDVYIHVFYHHLNLTRRLHSVFYIAIDCMNFVLQEIFPYRL